MTVTAINPALFGDFQSSTGPYTYTQTETAGALVQVVVFYDRGVASPAVTTIEVTSSPAKTFSLQLDKIDDIGNEEGGAQFYSNTPSPGGSVTYTVVFKNAGGTVITNAGTGICVLEVTGSSGFVNSNSSQSNSASITPTFEPYLLGLVAMCPAGNATPSVPATYATSGSGANFGTAQPLITAASKRFTAAGAQAPVSTNSTLTFVMTWAEAAANSNNALFFGNVA